MEKHSTTYTKFVNKDGSVRYYASYHSAWRAAVRLNQTAVGGLWYFEGDSVGWYLEFVPENFTDTAQ